MASPVIILRAESDAAPIVERLEHMGYAPIVNPLIQHLPAEGAQAELDAVSNADLLILTSAHGLDGVELPDAIKALPCFCVGQRTAAAAMQAGIDSCEIFPTASALADQLKETDYTAPLYLRGEHITQHFEGTKEIITYNAEAIMELRESAQEALNEHSDCIVLFTSGRLVHLFSLLLEEKQLEHLKTNITCLCMSDVIASKASVYGYQKSMTSDAPTLDALYTLIQNTQAA